MINDNIKQERRAQHDDRAAILVKGLESRACLTTILSYTCDAEDAKKLVRSLCKKGSDFLEKDQGMIENLCSAKKAEKCEPAAPTNNTLHIQQV